MMVNGTKQLFWKRFFRQKYFPFGFIHFSLGPFPSAYVIFIFQNGSVVHVKKPVFFSISTDLVLTFIANELLKKDLQQNTY